MWEKLLVQIALKAICKFFGVCLEDERCPDGVCEDLIADIEEIERKVTSGTTNFGISDVFGLVRCLDIPRLINAVKEVVAVIKDAKMCRDGESEITLGAAPDPGK